MSDLGSKMKQIRTARHYTQQEIADRMGVSRVYYSQWESNDRRVNAEQLIQFAKIVGVTLDFFSDNTEQHTLFQLLAQLENVFTSADIPDADKDKAYQDIMKLYLKSKEDKEVKNKISDKTTL